MNESTLDREDWQRCLRIVESIAERDPECFERVLVRAWETGHSVRQEVSAEAEIAEGEGHELIIQAGLSESRKAALLFCWLRRAGALD